MVHGNAVTASIIIEFRAISDPFDTLVTGLLHDHYLIDHYGYLQVFLHSFFLKALACLRNS